jgi:hypothetical protein
MNAAVLGGELRDAFRIEAERARPRLIRCLGIASADELLEEARLELEKKLASGQPILYPAVYVGYAEYPRPAYKTYSRDLINRLLAPALEAMRADRGRVPAFQETVHGWRRDRAA